MTSEVSEMKLQLEKLVYESKEAAITSDAMKEQNGELERELEELRVSSDDLQCLSSLYGDSSRKCRLPEISRRSQEQPEERRTGGQGQEASRENGCDHG